MFCAYRMTTHCVNSIKIQAGESLACDCLTVGALVISAINLLHVDEQRVSWKE